MKNVVISTKQLSRQYKIHLKPQGLLASLKLFFKRESVVKNALLPLTLEIAKGQIVGLVGANGAGKTTLLKLLSGLIYPTSGSATGLGSTPWARKDSFLRQISLLLGQKNQLWWDIPALDSFQLLITIYDLDPAAAHERIEQLSSRLNCQHVLQVPLRRLSLGERMKMELIGALLHSPQILFLDEPTIGLDIVAQNSIRQFILEELKGKGVTVILTSHYMDDIARLVDRLLLMSHGAIVYDGSVNHFMAQTPLTKRLEVEFVAPLEQAVRLPHGVLIPQGSLRFDHSWNAAELPEVIRILTLQAHIQDLKIEEPDFEDVIHKFFEKEAGLRPA